MRNIVLPSGKYQGKRISELPLDYVRWLATLDHFANHRSIPIAARQYLREMPHRPHTNMEPLALHADNCLVCRNRVRDDHLLILRTPSKSVKLYIHHKCLDKLLAESPKLSTGDPTISFIENWIGA